jgi:hypothetical protein
MSCGYYNSPNTESVCGEFETPTNADAGVCHPYRLKISCEAPVIPDAACGDTEFTVAYDPDATPKWRITSRTFDENCDPILDEDGNPILTVST